MRLTLLHLERAGPDTNLLIQRGSAEAIRPAKFERVGLNGETASELRAYVDGNRVGPDLKIWPHTSRAFQIAFRKATREAIDVDHHPHELRNLYSVDLLARGYPLALVSRMLGHSSQAVTRRWYTRITSGQRNAITRA